MSGLRDSFCDPALRWQPSETPQSTSHCQGRGASQKYSTINNYHVSPGTKAYMFSFTVGSMTTTNHHKFGYKFRACLKWFQIFHFSGDQTKISLNISLPSNFSSWQSTNLGVQSTYDVWVQEFEENGCLCFDNFLVDLKIKLGRKKEGMRIVSLKHPYERLPYSKSWW